MCFGGCGSVGNCAGSIAYILEKLASFIAMTAVILCIVMTVTISLGLGIGLGYNYCFVDLKIMKESELNNTMYRPPTNDDNTVFRTTTINDVVIEKTTLEPSGDKQDAEKGAAYRRRMPMSPRPRRMLPMPAIKQTMSIPLNDDLDFPALLSILRGRNKNVTLELITT